MQNPTLMRMGEDSLPVTQNTKKLFQVIYSDKKQKENESSDAIPKIKVSSFLSKMSFVYEKIRNSVDYKEDHLLRKNAIERILKREILIQGAIKKPESSKVADHLMTELIRAAYLPNNEVPEIKIDQIAKVIDKYIKLKDYIPEPAEVENKNKLINWVITLAACDVEEKLSSSLINDTIVKDAYNILDELVDVQADSPLGEDRNVQIYIAVQRKILKFDDSMIGFVLFKYYNPNWDNADDEKIAYAAEGLDVLRVQINEQINHPFRTKLGIVVSRYALFFNILTEVIQVNPKETYYKLQQGFKIFSFEIKKICNKKYKQARSKLWRAGLRSVIYILLTKSLFVYAFEKPIIEMLGSSVSKFTLWINICFPPLLLFLAILFTRLPSEKNTKKIIDGIEQIMFRKEKHDKQLILKKPVKRSRFMNFMFGLIYFVTFFASFGIVVWGLLKLDFHYVSIVIFLFFLAFVSFFSIRIRRSVNELKVIEARDNIFSFLVDFFYVPVIATGKWLSEKFARINIFVFIMDFIIEAPFKTLMQVIEEWVKYVKERKEEIV